VYVVRFEIRCDCSQSWDQEVKDEVKRKREFGLEGEKGEQDGKKEGMKREVKYVCMLNIK